MWEEVAAEALETAGRRMLNGENGTPVSPAGAGVAVASGVAGVELFAGDVPRWPDLLGGDGTEVALRSLSVFVEKAGTGGGLFRRLQTSFCHEVAERTGCVLADDAGAFWPRTVFGSLKSAWNLEKKRYARRNQHPFRLGNDVLNAWLMSAVLWAGLITWLGVGILPYLILQAVVGFSLLEVVNYMEHYGM